MSQIECFDVSSQLRLSVPTDVSNGNVTEYITAYTVWAMVSIVFLLENRDARRSKWLIFMHVRNMFDMKKLVVYFKCLMLLRKYGNNT